MKKIFFIILINLVLVGVGMAQWQEANNGISTQSINEIYVDPLTNNLYAATLGNIFISTNMGNNWIPTSKSLLNTQITSILKKDNKLFASANSGVYLLDNSTSIWTQINNGLPSLSIQTLAVSGNYLFTGTQSNGVYLSVNDGNTWVPVNNGLSGSSLRINTLEGDGSRIFAGTARGLYLSNDNGNNWSLVVNGLSNSNIESIIIIGNKILAGTSNGGVCLSKDNGSTWGDANFNMPAGQYVTSYEFIGSDIIAGTSNGIFLSSDEGKTWTASNYGLQKLNIYSIAVNGSNVFVGTQSGVFRSTDNGANWTEINNELPSTSINAIAINGNNIFTSTWDGVFLSSNDGNSWIEKSTGKKEPDFIVYPIVTSGEKVFAGYIRNGGVVLSIDNGDTWTEMNNGLPMTSGNRIYIYAMAISGSNIVIGSNLGLYLSDNNGNTWSEVNSTQTTRALVANGNYFFAGSSEGVFISENNGISWIKSNNGLTDLNIQALAISGSNIYAGTSNGGIFLSTDNGNSWKDISNGLTTKNIKAITVSGSNIFAGTHGGGVFRSKDNGSTWYNVNNGLTGNDLFIISLATNSNMVFAGTYVNGMWRLPLSDLSDLALSANALSLAAPANSSKTFDIISNTNWTISSDQSWLVPSSVSGSGNATITLTAQANTLPATRTATITISGTEVTTQTISVTQEALPANCGTVTDVDGNVYNTITIGTQCWMQENLKTTRFNDGTPIPYTTGYCWYNDDPNNKSIYGAMYSWSTVITADLCPTGWDIPTASEWNLLLNYLKSNGFGYQGSGDDIAKSLASSTGWTASLVPGEVGNDPVNNNITGFNAYPGGYHYNYGLFENIGNAGYWWLFFQDQTRDGEAISIRYNDEYVAQFHLNEPGSFSVRCAKRNEMALPAINSTAVSAITSSGAKSGGNITDDGNSPVTARGICWSKTAYPNLTDNKTLDGAGAGIFTSQITGLEPGTTYYIRPYATNSIGTIYGKMLTFSTLPQKISATLSGSSPGCFGVQSWLKLDITGGQAPYSINYKKNGIDQPAITAYNSGSVIALEILPAGTFTYEITSVKDAAESLMSATELPGSYTITINPIVAISAFAPATSTRCQGAGAATYTTTASNFTSLTYSLDAASLAAGNTINNLTGAVNFNSGWSGVSTITATATGCTSGAPGTVTASHTVTTTPSISGSSSITVPIFCNGETATVKISGSGGTGLLFYTFNGVTNTTGNFTGITASAVPYMWSISDRNACSLLTGSQTVTQPTTLMVSLESQTNVLYYGSPTGAINVIVSGGTGIYGYSWTGTDYLGNSFISGAEDLTGLKAGAYTLIINDANNCSAVLAMVNITQPLLPLPVLTTMAVSSITTMTASSGGIISSDGGDAITAHGLCWSTSTNPTITDNKTIDGIGTGAFTSSMTGLTGSTIYYVRAYATNTSGTAYGDQIQFQTAVHSDPSECLSLWYKLNGNADAETGFGTNGTLNGVVATEDRFGNANSACFFNGTNDFITIPGTLPISNVFSISFWAYSDRESGVGNILTDGSINLGGNDFLINFRGNNLGIRADKSGSSLDYEGFSPAELTNLNLLNRWVHVAWVMNPSGSTIYLDGVKIANINTTGTNEGYHDDHITIGARHVWTSMDHFFSGKLDDIRIYNCDLTEGDILSIFTEQGPMLATVKTNAITNLTGSTATSGGNIISDGGSAIIARGICWSTSTSPTITNNKTMDGTGLGAFTSYITGLVNGTTYYARTYATNSAGTAYGDEMTFIPNAFPNCGTITDVDGNVYKTVTIDNQCWMQENLKTTRYSDGTSIPYISNQTSWDVLTQTDKAYCWYDDNIIYKDIYGGLYSWAAAMNGASSSNSNPSGVQGICPTGWHLPSDAEWAQLESYLGSNVGGKLKEINTTHWRAPNAGATNESGFTGLPGGNRHIDGVFYDIESYGYWWSATEIDATKADNRALYYYLTNIGRDFQDDKVFGYSIRCLKDLVTISLPSILSQNATDITCESATSGGNVISDGGALITERGVCWGTMANPTISDNKTSDGTGIGTFTSFITGLNAGTVYYVRPYATNSVGTAYGYEISFITETPASTLSGSADACIGEVSSIRSVITGGVQPYTINYSKNGVAQPAITGYISGTEISLGILDQGPNIFEITSITDAVSYSFPVKALPASYIINIYKIPDAGTTINNSPFICNNETIDIVLHSDIPNTDFTYSVSFSPATTWQNGKAPMAGTVLNGEGVSIAQTLAHNSTEPVFVTYRITPQVPGTISCPGPSTNIVVVVNPIGQVNQPANLTVCDGSVVPATTFTTTNTPAISTFLWTNNNTAIGLAGWGFNATEVPSFTAVNTGNNPVTASIVVTPIFINGGSCIGPKKTFTITVKPNPKLTSTLTPPAICSNNLFSYNPTSATAGTTFSWSRASVTGISNIAASGTGNPNEILINTTAAPLSVRYIYTLTSNGCTNPTTYNIDVVVNPKPILVITNPPAACSPSTTDLTAETVTSGSTSGLTYTYWTNAGATTSYVTPATATAGTYYIKGIIPATGCYDINPVTVTVNPLPVLTSTLTPASICSNTSFSYTPASSIGGTIFNWTRATLAGINNSAGAGTGDPNELLINNTTAPVTVHYIYTLSANGCTNPATYDVAVVVNPTPVLSSTLTPAAICSNSTFSYTPVSSTPGTSFAWSRAAVAGINNSAATGTTIVNEILINTTTSPKVVTYVYSLTANGCINSQNVSVTVNPTPLLSSTLTPMAVCSDAAFNYTPTCATIGTTFSWDRAAVAGISNAPSTGTFAVSEILINTTAFPIPVTYLYTLASSGCVNTQNVTVTVNPMPVITSPNASTICSGASTNVTLNSNVSPASYTWSLGPITSGITGATAGSGTTINQLLNNTGSTAGTVTYIVYPISGSCTGAPTNIVVTVNPATGQTTFTSGNIVFCQDAPDETYTATAANSTSVTYSVSPAIAGTINNITGVMNWNAAFNGIATITATSSGLCGITSADRIVIINPTTGSPVFTAGKTSICQNSADETYIATSTSSSSITYSVSPSSAGVINSSTGVMNWDASFTGTATITATANGLCGTTSSARIVTVNSTPILNVTNPAPVCAPATIDLTAATVTSGSTSGLTYIYWTNAGATTSYITPATATAGTYYIKGIIPATGCYDIKPVTVTVNPLPVLTSTLTPASTCSNTSFSYSPASSIVGTIFNWTRATVAGLNNSSGAGTGNPNELLINNTTAPVTVHYIYTLSANGCTNPATYDVAVVVNPTPILSNTLNPAAICSNSLFSYTPVSATSATTFEWSRAAVAGISNSPVSGNGNPNETLTNTTPDPVVVTYNYALSANGCSNVQNVAVTVNPKPVLSSTLMPAAICSNSVFSYSPASMTAGTTFVWSRAEVAGISNSAASGAGSVNETLINNTTSPKAVTYVYTLTANGCSNTQNVTVTINPIPVASTASLMTICSGTLTNILLNSNVDGTTFTWTLGPVTGGITGASASNGSTINQMLTNQGIMPGTVTYLVTPSANFCSGNSSNIVVTINPKPVLTNPGPIQICSESFTNIVLNSNIPGTTYSWSLGPITGGITGAVPSSGPVINQMLVNPVTIPGTVTYIVTPTVNFCQGNPVNIVVTVNPKPVAATSSTTNYCSGTLTNILLNSTIPGTTFTWTIGPITGGITGASAAGGPSINQTLNNPGNTPGTVTYIVTPLANFCQGNPKNIVVTVNPIPTVTTVSSTTICNNTSTNLILNGNVPATTFNWTVGIITGGITGVSNSTGSSINQVLTNPLMTSGTVTYMVTPIANSCVGIPLNIIMTVNPLTGAPLFTAGATTVCQNAPDETYTVTALNSTSIRYSVMPVSAGIINPLSGVMNWDASFTGNAIITATASGLCGTTVANRLVAVNPSTGITIFTTGPTSVCQNSANVTYTATAANATHITYTLLPLTAGTINSSTGVIDWDEAFTGTATVRATAIGLCGTTSFDRQVMVNPAPVLIINNPVSVCYPSTVDLTSSAVTTGSTSGLTYTYWTDAGATSAYTIPSAAIEGTYYIKGRTSEGCNDIKPVRVTVNQRPVAVANSSQTICPGENATVSGTIALNGNALWATDGMGTLSNVTALTPTYRSSVGDEGRTVRLTLTVTSNNVCFPQTATSVYTIEVKKAQEISFPTLPEKMYGEGSFALNATANSLLNIIYTSGNNSILSVSGNNATIHNAGVSTIYANQPGNSIYCAAPEVSQIVTVRQKLITVVAKPLQSKYYGEPDSLFQFTFSPALIGNDVFTGSLARSLGEDAGTYAINIGSITPGSNYRINFIPENFTINKAPLTVSANPVERHYLEINPNFSLTFSGFVNGETQSVLDVLPSVTSNAEATSDAGNYSLVVSGGSDNNYYYVYTNGVLTIQKADQHIVFEEIPDKLRISQTYELVATASSGLPVSFESSDLKKAVITGNTMLVNKEGRNIITARQEGDMNWNPAPDVSNTYVGQPSFDNITSLFTPNGDGVNDAWHIPEIEDFGSVQVKVYNRFGKLVYESSDYKNDWNGSFNGSPLPSASYYFIIKSSVKGIINGVVNIVR